MKRNAPSPMQREALEAVAAGRCVPSFVREEDGWHARWRATGPDNPWIDEYMRAASLSPLVADAEDCRYETIHDAWIVALRSRTGLVRRDDSECAAFAAELDGWAGAAICDEDAKTSVSFSFSAGGDSFSLSCPAPRGRRALRALGQAAAVFRPLARMTADGPDRVRVALSKDEAVEFLSGGCRALADAGYRVEGCDIAASVSAEAGVDAPPDAGGAPARGDATLKVVVRVDGEPVGENEIRFLLDQKSTLVFFRDRWIEVDRGILKEALRVLERQNGRKLSVNEAVAFVSGAGSCGRLDVGEAAARGWVRGLVEELRRAGRSPLDGETPLSGVLRPYQIRGALWLRFMTDRGFGALLADDMGLGKTVQTLSLILSCRGDGPFLVLAPLSLLANWRREAAKFAPSLKVLVHHGWSRASDSVFARQAAASDMVVTSYQLLARDWSSVRRVKWAGVVMDEAQCAKNPQSQAARALSALGAPRRIALTGTPVENSALDVWSLENILNPGLLGDEKTFRERFAKPVAADPSCRAAKRLARTLEPFILRRLKTDPSIAGEIGEKRIVREYCALSPGQRAEYEDALAAYDSGERRKGDSLALLTRLKQVCDGEGKLARLFDLVDSVFDAGESVLVFTQFAKTGAWLASALAGRFGRPVPFLHGSLDAAARESQIACFQSSPGPSAFVLSLRAGGYGLNLTKATHVIHFDRWWNPAVEAQATDRAHRIGQRSTVLSHLFITEGTIEERVDAVLERKTREAGAVVSDGESFLLSLAPEELRSLAALDPAACAGKLV